MNIIDHGAWSPYKPAKFPEDAPLHAMFALRKSDTVDWYDYVNSGENFGADTVKFMAIWRDGVGYVVGPAVYDPTLLFPANHIVAEITDYIGTAPQADFGNKVYDPATGSFSDQPPPPPPPPTLQELMARLAALEARL
jgi:hypothetical protein